MTPSLLKIIINSKGFDDFARVCPRVIDNMLKNPNLTDDMRERIIEAKKRAKSHSDNEQ